MRFIWGPIPPGRVLNPQEEQWTPLRELGTKRLALVASLLGLPFLVAAVIVLRSMSGQLRGLVEDPAAGRCRLSDYFEVVPVLRVRNRKVPRNGNQSMLRNRGSWSHGPRE